MVKRRINRVPVVEEIAMKEGRWMMERRRLSRRSGSATIVRGRSLIALMFASTRKFALLMLTISTIMVKVGLAAMMALYRSARARKMLMVVRGAERVGIGFKRIAMSSSVFSQRILNCRLIGVLSVRR
jgi:hypothetical protein